MEDQVDSGRTKRIGLSNFNAKQIQRILDNCRIQPDNLQNENHLYLQEPELVEFCKANGIAMTAYSCLGTKGSREAYGMSWTYALIEAILHTFWTLNYDYFSNCFSNKLLPEILDNEMLVGVAKKYAKTPAQVMLRYVVQKGLCVIPKSTNPIRMEENFRV